MLKGSMRGGADPFVRQQLALARQISTKLGVKADLEELAALEKYFD